MEIGSIFLILALAILVFLFISRPLFEPAGKDRLVVQAEIQQREHQRSSLLAERDRVLNALQELEVDNELGKLPPEEYKLQREKLLKSGAEALRLLDEINLADEPAQPERGRAAEDDELEALIAARRRTSQSGKRHEAAQVFCASCGNPLKLEDRFCPVCGTKTR